MSAPPARPMPVGRPAVTGTPVAGGARPPGPVDGSPVRAPPNGQPRGHPGAPAGPPPTSPPRGAPPAGSGYPPAAAPGSKGPSSPPPRGPPPQGGPHHNQHQQQPQGYPPAAAGASPPPSNQAPSPQQQRQPPPPLRQPGQPAPAPNNDGPAAPRTPLRRPSMTRGTPGATPREGAPGTPRERPPAPASRKSFSQPPPQQSQPPQPSQQGQPTQQQQQVESVDQRAPPPTAAPQYQQQQPPPQGAEPQPQPQSQPEPQAQRQPDPAPRQQQSTTVAPSSPPPAQQAPSPARATNSSDQPTQTLTAATAAASTAAGVAQSSGIVPGWADPFRSEPSAEITRPAMLAAAGAIMSSCWSTTVLKTVAHRRVDPTLPPRARRLVKVQDPPYLAPVESDHLRLALAGAQFSLSEQREAAKHRQQSLWSAADAVLANVGGAPQLRIAEEDIDVFVAAARTEAAAAVDASAQRFAASQRLPALETARQALQFQRTVAFGSTALLRMRIWRDFVYRRRKLRENVAFIMRRVVTVTARSMWTKWLEYRAARRNGRMRQIHSFETTQHEEQQWRSTLADQQQRVEESKRTAEHAQSALRLHRESGATVASMPPAAAAQFAHREGELQDAARVAQDRADVAVNEYFRTLNAARGAVTSAGHNPSIGRVAAPAMTSTAFNPNASAGRYDPFLSTAGGVPVRPAAHADPMSILSTPTRARHGIDSPMPGGYMPHQPVPVAAPTAAVPLQSSLQSPLQPAAPLQAESSFGPPSSAVQAAAAARAALHLPASPTPQFSPYR